MLITIPCAILPIMMATGGMLSIPFSPLLFRYDFLLFSVVYVTYSAGLYFSWQQHHRLIPFLVFIVHACALAGFVFIAHPEWLSYLSILSIMATSLSNQYYRTGSTACAECQQ